jgi:general secretion pathway protein F
LRIVVLQALLPTASRAVARKLERAVVEGASLSEALAASGAAFPPYYARLVRAGESGGALAETLEDLANFIEHAKAQRDRIRSALAYPMILLAAAVVSLGVIVAVLVPAIAPLFEDAGVDAPPIIAVLMSLQQVIGDHMLLVAAALVVAFASVVTVLRSERVRQWWDEFVLRLPIVGRLVRCRDTARVARTLAILDRGGVAMLDALDIAAQVPANRVMRGAVEHVRRDVAEGASLSESLYRSGQFGELFVRLVTIGERSSRLGQMLARLADMDEAVLRRDTERLTGLVGPVLTLLIGFVVGGLVLSVLGAVIGINELALR